jgi:hypothetical protein
MTVSGVLGDAWALYRRFFRRFVATAAAVFVVVDLLFAIADDANDHNRTLAFVWLVVATLALIVGQVLLQAALVEAVDDARDGRIDTTIGDLYRRTRFAILPLLAVGIVASAFAILAGILVGFLGIFGILLVVVPAVWLLARWALMAPVIVVERRRVADAFRRASALVRGRMGFVLGVVAVTVLVSFVALVALVTVFAFLPRFLELWIGFAIAHSIVVPYLLIAWTIAYFELRERAEA